jgi:tetratricopeptide (TPR) repeat protein
MGLGLTQTMAVRAQAHSSARFGQYKALNSTIERALKAVRSGRFEEAKAVLKPCLETVPDHFEAHYLLALMAYEDRDFAGVLTHLDIAERAMDALDRDRRRLESEMKARSGSEQQEAQDNLSVALSRTSDPSGFAATKIAGLKMDATIAEQKNKPVQGVENPYAVPADYWYLRGNALFRLGRREEAKGAYWKAIGADASHANAWNNLIALSLGARDLTAARADLAEAEAAGVSVRPALKKAVQEAR